MNVLRLSEVLSENPSHVIKVLESIGYDNIRYDSSKNTLRFPRRLGGNPTSVIMSCNSLIYNCFSTNSSGNIYTLVMDRRGLNFPLALGYICDLLNLEKSTISAEVTPPFGGFYKSIARTTAEDFRSLITYPDSTLDDYSDVGNLMFVKDGIDVETQSVFNVGYDRRTDRITVPQYTVDGKLCGIMGRLNDSMCPHEERWFPIISCQRSLTLYGFHINYHSIVDKKTIVIGESEKFVQQCYSFGCHVALATCGCHLSDAQAKYIKSLMPKKVIFAYDEGLDEELVREQVKKLLSHSSSLFEMSAGYIWDSGHDLLAEGSKMNAADLGRCGFTELMKSKVKYIN